MPEAGIDGPTIDANGLLSHFVPGHTRVGEGGRAAALGARSKLIVAFTDAIAAAVGAGDLHGARIAYGALGHLLAEPEAGAAVVADLGAEPARRGQR